MLNSESVQPPHIVILLVDDMSTCAPLIMPTLKESTHLSKRIFQPGMIFFGEVGAYN